ncbi:type VI secretion system-associated FHA domain protein TagH [Bradyrhizobium sp. WSM1417]|uniref:type VI secretion system-associated FHA domain protein TagH n=1 Tax=Bradyrhizobium sp. WSM1417 TaxID=754500 RepID=UPI000482AC28|nr:type VI secretion system-associated FHA domain protein TagH [Bradyrhizobium sp. WSM1417]
MALRLTIENLSTLPDGGPISFTMEGTRPVDIGRDKHVDWTLPDPTRYISGKHCEIHYRDNGYWIQDVSTNGTFLSGSDHRVRSPHQLRDGDRLIIGHYMIAVAIERDSIATESPYAGPAVVQTSISDVWGIEREFPEPNTGPQLAGRLPQPAAPPAPTVDWTGGGSAEDIAPARPMPSRSSGDRGAATPLAWGDDQSQAAPFPQPAKAAQPPAPGEEDTQRESVNPFIAPPAATEPATKAAETSTTLPNASSSPNLSTIAETNIQARDGGQAFARRIATGASLPDDFFDGRNPEELTQQIGQLIRLSVENVMALLQARNEAKRMTRSKSQTTVQATENNALKFATSAEDAMKIMFGPKSQTYLDARTAFDQGFRDLKSHQQQTYAAMQHAIAVLSTELDPANIEKNAREHASTLDTLRSHKGRLWDTHIARWKAGFGREPGAAVEQFMQYFGEYYDGKQDGDPR